MITAHKVLQCTDLTEGKGGMAVRGIFLDEQDAISFSNSLDGIQGTRQGIQVEPVEIYEALEEHPKITKEMIRKSALAKLTDREKEILGVN